MGKPRAYYSEWDPYAAAWLRNLIAAGHIAPGDVDERSIEDVRPDDLRGYTQCHFFAGIGGWSLAARLAGWPDDRELWSGSEPCQPYSVAGKGLGEADERFLRPHVHRLIAARRPAVYVGEQVAAAAGKNWLDRVHSDMESIDYTCRSVVVPARAVRAPHRRDRLWFIAHTERNEQPRQEPRSGSFGRMGRIVEPLPWNEPWQSALSRFRVVGDGLPRSVGATDAARNAIVPQVAAEVIGAYLDTLDVRFRLTEVSLLSPAEDVFS